MDTKDEVLVSLSLLLSRALGDRVVRCNGNGMMVEDLKLVSRWRPLVGLGLTNKVRQLISKERTVRVAPAVPHLRAAWSWQYRQHAVCLHRYLILPRFRYPQLSLTRLGFS